MTRFFKVMWVTDAISLEVISSAVRSLRIGESLCTIDDTKPGVGVSEGKMSKMVRREGGEDEKRVRESVTEEMRRSVMKV